MNTKRSLSPAVFFNSKFTATISISLVLFLLGLVLLIVLLANNLSEYVKENLAFNIVLADHIQPEEVSALQNKLEKTAFVKAINYISKEDAAIQVENELGLNPETFLGYNPLPSLLEVRLRANYADPDSIPLIEQHIRGLSSDISSIEYRQDIIQLVTENLAKVGLIVGVIAIILICITFALITNTIRLMIYSKRFLIHTMKLVGATSGFIRRPFIWSNIFSGIIGACIACGLLAWLLYYAKSDLFGTTEIVTMETLYIVFGSVFALGILISWIATFKAVNKYIEMDGDDLFYM